MRLCADEESVCHGVEDDGVRIGGDAHGVLDPRPVQRHEQRLERLHVAPRAVGGLEPLAPHVRFDELAEAPEDRAEGHAVAPYEVREVLVRGEHDVEPGALQPLRKREARLNVAARSHGPDDDAHGDVSVSGPGTWRETQTRGRRLVGSSGGLAEFDTVAGEGRASPMAARPRNSTGDH